MVIAADFPQYAVNSLFYKALVVSAGPSSVTLPRRRLATVVGDPRRRGWRCRRGAACRKHHGGDLCRPTGPAALVAGRVGVGAVAGEPALPGGRAVAGRAAAPG